MRRPAEIPAHSPRRRKFPPQNSVSLPPFLRRTAHRFPASLCICPSHGLPILKIPLKIDPLCFMPASDRGPPGKTERLSAASLRILSGTASARPPPKAALFPTPKTTVSAVCACPLQNSTASLSPGLRRIHSGKFSLRRAVQGEKFPGIFLCRRQIKVFLFYFYRSTGARARFFSAFSRLSARISRAAISSPATAVPLPRGFAETVPADIRRPACFPPKNGMLIFPLSTKNGHKKNAPHDETRFLFLIQQDQSRAALTMRSSSRIARSSGVRRITAAVGTPSASRRSFSFFVSSSISSLER